MWNQLWIRTLSGISSNNSNKSLENSENYFHIHYIYKLHNHLPALKHYRSQKESMENRTIDRVISRDRFTFVNSKLYFASPKELPNASKTYYVEKLVSCLKFTFSKSREDSPFQSRWIYNKNHRALFLEKIHVTKIYQKRYQIVADSGYTYDLNIYSVCLKIIIQWHLENESYKNLSSQ